MILALILYCHSSNLNKCFGCTLFSKFKEKYLIQRGQFDTLASWQALVSSHWIDFVQESFFIKYIVRFVKSFLTSFNVERRLSLYIILLNLERSHETGKAAFHKSSYIYPCGNTTHRKNWNSNFNLQPKLETQMVANWLRHNGGKVCCSWWTVR